jgi:uncharacterized protein YqeY
MRVLEAALRKSLKEAMKARDATTTSAIRSALSAIDNAGSAGVSRHAEGLGSGPRAGSTQGIGAGDVPRKELDEGRIRAIVRSEVTDRERAAAEYEGLGRSQEAARLHAERAVLLGFLQGEGAAESRSTG